MPDVHVLRPPVSKNVMFGYWFVLMCVCLGGGGTCLIIVLLKLKRYNIQILHVIQVGTQIRFPCSDENREKS